MKNISKTLLMLGMVIGMAGSFSGMAKADGWHHGHERWEHSGWQHHYHPVYYPPVVHYVYRPYIPATPVFYSYPAYQTIYRPVYAPQPVYSYSFIIR